MPAWPGGTCPECGEFMPVNLIHCQSCRTLLNDDLETDSVEVPEFIPLQDIDAMAQVEPPGYFVDTNNDNVELRINRKYLGKEVQRKDNAGTFLFDLSNPDISIRAFYATCPHCGKEIRAAFKYLGTKVACKYCGGKIHLVKTAR